MNKNQNLLIPEFSNIYRIEHTGTGTYRISAPTVITFEQPINILFFSSYLNTVHIFVSRNYLLSEEIPIDDYASFHIVNNDSSNSVYIKRNSSSTSFTFYGKSSNEQLNDIGYLNIFYGLSGKIYGEKYPVIKISATSTFTIPYTGNYYIELYGRGGGGYHENNSSSYGSGGSSCQSYNNIELTKGQQISVTIGTGGNSGYWQSATSGTATTFGSYTVARGGAGRSDYGGAGAGNLGTSGIGGVDATSSVISNGKLAPLKYRYGMAGIGNMPSGDGAVVLKYLRT